MRKSIPRIGFPYNNVIHCFKVNWKGIAARAGDHRRASRFYRILRGAGREPKKQSFLH
jgi:hypothetical protein